MRSLDAESALIREKCSWEVCNWMVSY